MTNLQDAARLLGREGGKKGGKAKVPKGFAKTDATVAGRKGLIRRWGIRVERLFVLRWRYSIEKELLASGEDLAQSVAAHFEAAIDSEQLAWNDIAIEKIEAGKVRRGHLNFGEVLDVLVRLRYLRSAEDALAKAWIASLDERRREYFCGPESEEVFEYDDEVRHRFYTRCGIDLQIRNAIDMDALRANGLYIHAKYQIDGRKQLAWIRGELISKEKVKHGASDNNRDLAAAGAGDRRDADPRRDRKKMEDGRHPRQKDVRQ